MFGKNQIKKEIMEEMGDQTIYPIIILKSARLIVI